MLFFLSLAVIFKSMDFPFTVSGISPMSSVSEIQVLQEIQEIRFLLCQRLSMLMTWLVFWVYDATRTFLFYLPRYLSEFLAVVI